ncbi:MAG: hypothetical protein NC251_08265 [Lachnoclostridium sp.]|nr:hypothetical protein [Lachnospira sp.]MCM1248408.1 hypothetical protein [Lachnoclostridium sp.]
MKYRYRLLFWIAAVGGVYLSLMYINPYFGTITLSEAVLQLSGSRGGFVQGFSYTALISFTMRLFPAFVVEAYAGIMLYQHFCTASVYVFSRYPRRVKWYLGEACRLVGAVCIFHLLLLAVALFTAAVRYELQIDSAGAMVLAYHFAIHSLWTYAMTLSVNLLAVYFGSSTAYALVVSVQMVCIALLNLMDFLVKHSGGGLAYEDAVIWNPMAHLVLGWHDRHVANINPAEAPYDIWMDLNGSLIMFFLLGAALTLAGAFIIKKHDILVSDLETEV